MSLNWDMSAVANRDETVFHGEGDDRRMVWWAETIIFATMVIGLGEITAKNAEEFWARLDMYQKVAGGLASVGPDREIAWLVPKHVRKLVGLRTNAFPTTTPAAFAKRMREVSGDRSRTQWDWSLRQVETP